MPCHGFYPFINPSNLIDYEKIFTMCLDRVKRPELRSIETLEAQMFDLVWTAPCRFPGRKFDQL